MNTSAFFEKARQRLFIHDTFLKWPGGNTNPYIPRDAILDLLDALGEAVSGLAAELSGELEEAISLEHAQFLLFLIEAVVAANCDTTDG